MRNIQNKLILYWSNKNNISEIISELPSFCNNFENQVKEGILPNIGSYYLNSYKYDINDFLSNTNNICFKIKVPYQDEDDLILKDKFLLITSTTIIILESEEKNSRNICIINYIGELFAVENIEDYKSDKIIFEQYYCLKINWTKNISLPYNNVICVENEEKLKTDIKDIILVRRDIIKNNFQFFEKNEKLEIDDYKFIIDIKKKLIQNQPNEIIYDEINRCYQKIIEMLSNEEDESIQNYITELHKFIEDYGKD